MVGPCTRGRQSALGGVVEDEGEGMALTAPDRRDAVSYRRRGPSACRPDGAVARGEAKALRVRQERRGAACGCSRRLQAQQGRLRLGTADVAAQGSVGA